MARSTRWCRRPAATDAFPLARPPSAGFSPCSRPREKTNHPSNAQSRDVCAKSARKIDRFAILIICVRKLNRLLQVSAMTPSSPQCTPALAPDLQLGDPEVDTIHAEFVHLLDLADRATDEELIAALDVWIDHTRQHFAQEESWMEATGFGPRHCHAGQHGHVLHVSGLVRAKMADEGRFDLGRRLVSELRDWFAHHVTTMDSMMVSHLREHGISHVA